MGYQWMNIAATTAAVANRFVTSTNMKVGSYTVANTSPVWAGGCLVTVTHTTVATGTDTLGTITVTGTDLTGAALSETITPVADNVATGTRIFRTVATVVGAGWVIAGGNDTLTVGCAAGCYVMGGGGTFHGLVVNNSVAAAVPVSDARGTIMTVPSSAAAGTLYILDVEASGFLKIATTSNNDLTVFHSGTQPVYTAT